MNNQKPNNPFSQTMKKLKNYYEVNFGLENIFKVVRFDYVLAYGINGKVSNGFLIGLGIDF